MSHWNENQPDLRDLMGPRGEYLGDRPFILGAKVSAVEVSDTELVLHFDNDRVLRCLSAYDCAEEILFRLTSVTADVNAVATFTGAAGE